MARLLIDRFGRRITYVRLSVTDRCDFRCSYCMPLDMAFLPKAEVLTLEELAAIARAFVARGVNRIRLTGGEPLVRRGLLDLVHDLAPLLRGGLDELTLTTNGSQLARFAGPLFAAGIRRVNVSLDSRDPDRFAAITRRGRLGQVLEGIDAAREAGLRVKINMVALKGLNEDEILPMVAWCGEQGHDLSFIETMPLGRIEEDRTDRY
ncbi:MAG: GTP 3',8-cyclase MoaA, partial [Thermaurantiacus sp.]